MSKKKRYDDDDGHTIANMNVPGMPWYHENTTDAKHIEPLSKEDTRAVMLCAVKWVFIFSVIFCAIMALVVYIMTKVWS
ncbi:MAG: hypothetical protein RR232_05930 [Clostridia bacterium]